MPAAPVAAFVKARTYASGVPCNRIPKKRKIIITVLRSTEPPRKKSFTTRKQSPSAATTQLRIRLFSIFSAGVVDSFFSAGTSSAKRSGSTETTFSFFGCISAFTSVIAMMMTATITRLWKSKTVWVSGTGAVRMPLVAFFSASPGVAIVSGMEPDRPACHTTKPL